MPLLERRDGVKICWEERGEGPLVVFALQFFSGPEVYEGLISDLAADHRIVTYDARGTGTSARQGPYDLDTAADDLAAVVERAGGPALVVATGDGCNRAVRVAAQRSDLVAEVVSPAGNPVGRQAAEGTDGLVASDSVIEAMMGMVNTDYRGALRTLLATANPQLTDDQVRERVNEAVAYCPQGVAVARLEAWIADNAARAARAIGERLWLLEHGTNPWFPIGVVRKTRELLPEAHIEEVSDGPLSRPDITAGVVRSLTAARARQPVSEGREQPL